MKTLQTRLHVERLESRALLAGNVAVSLSGGNLLVAGDDLANRISIESDGAGRVQIRGFDSVGGTPTGINGSPNATRTFQVGAGNITVQLAGGNDLVRVTNLVADGNLSIDGGEGNDEIITGAGRVTSDARFGGTPTGPLWVHGDLRISAGNGNDFVYQSELHNKGNCTIGLGAGKDKLLARSGPSGREVRHFGAMSVFPGPGNDSIAIANHRVDGNLRIVDVDGYNLGLRNSEIEGNLVLSSGGSNNAAGVDTINVANVKVRNALSVSTRGGDDVVDISARVDVLFAALGTGRDRLELRGVTANRINAGGGGDDDTFLVESSRAFDGFFSGGGGSDTFDTTASQPNRFPNSSIKFENRV